MSWHKSAKYAVAGINVNELTFDEAIQMMLDAPSTGRRLRVHFCTVHTLVEASRDLTLSRALNASEAIIAPDGVPLVWLGRLQGRSAERVCGPDVMPALIDLSRSHNYRHFFFGGAPAVPESLADAMRERFPGMQVAGTFSPPFRPPTQAESEAIVERINLAAPDFVWVGLGSPKQDRWLADHRDSLDAAVLLAVGAAFDFHTGKSRRAPRWMQRSGLEWLFRLISEPRRLAGRYTVVNALFLGLLTRDLARAVRRWVGGKLTGK